MAAMTHSGLPVLLPIGQSDEVSQVWTIGGQGGSPGQLDWPSDVVYTPTGYLAVADYGNKRIQLYDSRGQPHLAFGQGLIQPFCITVIPGSCDLIVTDQLNKCTTEFSMSGEMKCRNGIGTFEEPSGIAAFQDDSWVCTDTKLHTAHIYDDEGNFIRSFGSRGRGDQEFNWPGYVATDSKGRAIVSDVSNNAIKFFDRDGRYISKVTTTEGARKLWFPKGLCVDYMDNIYVVEWGYDRVIMLDSNGRFVTKVVDFESNLCNPHGVDVDLTRQLAVTARAPFPCVHVLRHNYDLSSSHYNY